MRASVWALEIVSCIVCPPSYYVLQPTGISEIQSEEQVGIGIKRGVLEGQERQGEKDLVPLCMSSYCAMERKNRYTKLSTGERELDFSLRLTHV